MLTLAAIFNIAVFGTYFLDGYVLPTITMHFFSLGLSKYLNIIFNKRRQANDFQDGEKYKMAATFHIMSFIEPKQSF